MTRKKAHFCYARIIWKHYAIVLITKKVPELWAV